MKKYIFFFFLLVCFNQVMNAQVKIGGDTNTPADPSAVLELQSTTKGLLLARVDNPSSIANPATGLLIYNTTSNVVQVNVGTPAAPLWVTVVVSQGTGNTGAVIVSVGTTGQRPTSPVAGMIRLNTSTGKFEGYTGTAWVDLN